MRKITGLYSGFIFLIYDKTLEAIEVFYVKDTETPGTRTSCEIIPFIRIRNKTTQDL